MEQRHTLIKEGISKPLVVIIILFILVIWFFNKILKRFGRIKHQIESSYGRLKTILDTQSDIIIITDGKRLLEANKAFLKFFKLKNVDHFLQYHDCICDYFETEKNKHYLQRTVGQRTWVEYIQKNPKLTHKVKIQQSIFTVHIDGYLSDQLTTEYIVVFNDITAIEQHQAQLHQLAYFDTLTELPNRADFINTLHQALSQESLQTAQSYALMFLDLDGFKQVNDIYGHNIGDQLLKEAAERINSKLQPKDYIARLGGDEFIVLIHHYDGKPQLAQIAESIIKSLNQTFLIHNRKLFVGASIGIALFPEDAEEGDTLLKNADIAMYHAKDHGKNQYAFYTAQMGSQLFKHQEIEDNLKTALSQGELYLVYQPQVDSITQKLIGVEALIRWKHPAKGEIYPDQFIPIAEKSHLIVQIGDFVLKQAITELGELAQISNFKLSINTTNKELEETDFVQKTMQTCQTLNFDMSYLEIEFIERDALEDINMIRQIINTLHKQGVTFALDDFGTGYSSLSYINRLNIDKLKIDKSFIENIFMQGNRLAIVKSIIAIAENINLSVIAEGVTKQEELDVLIDLKCPIIQGYLVAKPMKISDLKPFLANL